MQYTPHPHFCPSFSIAAAELLGLPPSLIKVSSNTVGNYQICHHNMNSCKSDCLLSHGGGKKENPFYLGT